MMEWYNKMTNACTIAMFDDQANERIVSSTPFPFFHANCRVFLIFWKSASRTKSIIPLNNLLVASLNLCYGLIL